MSNPGNMNFLPEDYVEKRQAAKTAIIFIGLLLVVIGGIIGMWLYTVKKNKPILEENARVNTLYEESTKKIAEFQAMDQERAKMVAKAEVTTALMEKVRRFALLEELTRLRPKGVSFLDIRLRSEQTSSSVQLSDYEKAQREQSGLSGSPSVQRYDVNIDLVGLAPTDEHVAEYIADLTKNKLFTDVDLVYTQEFVKTYEDLVKTHTSKEEKEKEKVRIRKEVLRKFHVTMRIDPTADLRGGGGSTTAATNVEETIATK